MVIIYKIKYNRQQENRAMKKLFIILLPAVLLLSCGQKETEKTYKVEVKTADFAFLAPAEMPSGWITFELNNSNAQHVHEISISRLPEGIDYQVYMKQFVTPWETILSELQDGKIEVTDIFTRANELLPDWADKVQYITSRGLVSPGHKAEKTIYLEPGKYVMECWVKTAEGEIHISKGMTLPFTVSEQTANSTEPQPEEKITVNAQQIDTDWNPGLGKHSFAVHLQHDSAGTPVHNNINLIRLNDNTDLAEVNKWLDWYHVGGLRSPAPAVFLGGLSTYHSKVGQKAEYFTVYLDNPGKYAWIVEVPDGQKLWKTFEVD